jgi:hypothetical protein
MHKLGEEEYDDRPEIVAYHAKLREHDAAMQRACDPNLRAYDRAQATAEAESLGCEAMQMPRPGHNLTAYVCCSHFRMVMGPAVKCGETTYDVALAGYEMLQASIHELQSRADETAARNYMSIQMVGIQAPFDRATIELIRPGGKTPHERAEENKQLVRRCILAMHRLADDVQRGKVAGGEAEREKAAAGLRKFADELAGQIA